MEDRYGGKIRECTPDRIKDLDSLKEIPYGNPSPSEYSCKTNICWNSEQAEVPRCKSIVAPIANRVGKLKILCKDMSSFNTNDKIRGSLPLNK